LNKTFCKPSTTTPRRFTWRLCKESGVCAAVHGVPRVTLEVPHRQQTQAAGAHRHHLIVSHVQGGMAVPFSALARSHAPLESIEAHVTRLQLVLRNRQAARRHVISVAAAPAVWGQVVWTFTKGCPVKPRDEGRAVHVRRHCDHTAATSWTHPLANAVPATDRAAI
jgi:hypothetical protein